VKSIAIPQTGSGSVCHSAVAAAAARGVVIDLTAIPLVDAAGVAVLRDALVTAALAHVMVTVIGVQPYVAQVLVAVGLSDES
jgi:RNA polymerase sigma-B factor